MSYNYPKRGKEVKTKVLEATTIVNHVQDHLMNYLKPGVHVSIQGSGINANEGEFILTEIIETGKGREDQPYKYDEYRNRQYRVKIQRVLESGKISTSSSNTREFPLGDFAVMYIRGWVKGEKIPKPPAIRVFTYYRDQDEKKWTDKYPLLWRASKYKNIEEFIEERLESDTRKPFQELFRCYRFREFTIFSDPDEEFPEPIPSIREKEAEVEMQPLTRGTFRLWFGIDYE